jgi:hypothetical protein
MEGTDYEGSMKIVRQTLRSKLGFKKSEYWFVLKDNVLSWHLRRGEAAVDFFLLQEAKSITPDGAMGIVIQATQEAKALLLIAVSSDDRDKWVSLLVSLARAASSSHSPHSPPHHSARITKNARHWGSPNHHSSSSSSSHHHRRRIQCQCRPRHHRHQ